MAKISPAAAMVKPTPPRAMRVSMSKPTHQPHGYAWLMLAIVAMPVAKRTTVASTAAMTSPQSTSAITRHRTAPSAAGMLFVVVVVMVVMGPEADAPVHDHRDDRHRHPDRPEDLGREVQQLGGED